MKNFELFCGCFGNGTTICNKAVKENGDYKKIAHISEGGNICLYVADGYIPVVEMEQIKAMANKVKVNFKRKFERLPEIEQYEKILNLDILPHQKFMEFVGDKRPLKEKLPLMREYYYTIV